MNMQNFRTIAFLAFLIFVISMGLTSSCGDNQCSSKAKYKKYKQVEFCMSDSTSRGIILYVEEPSINNNCHASYRVGYFNKLGTRQSDIFDESEITIKK